MVRTAAGVCLLAAVVSACRTPDHRADQDTAIAPDSGRWALTPHEAASGFSLELPDSATIDSIAPDRSGAVPLAVTGFPGCEHFCSIVVRLHRDSLGGLGPFVAAVARPNSDAPESADYAPRVKGSVTINGSPALEVEYWCGDCLHFAYFLPFAGRIADIDMEIDARDAAMEHELRRVAQTFRG